MAEEAASSGASIVDAFRRHYGHRPEVVVRAPGRVNLLGAHIDTSGGWVLPAAIDRSIWLAVSRREDLRIRLAARDLGGAAHCAKTAELDLGALPPPVEKRAAGDGAVWSDYPGGVAWALLERGPRPPGIDALYGGDLPIGAGVSSSAAVEMAFCLAWEALADPPTRSAWALDGASRALLGQRVENAYLGVRSGVMDQFACLHGRAGHALRLDCRTLDHELLELPAQTSVLVADSRVRRRLVGSGFNDRRAEVAEALAVVRQERPEVESLRDVRPNELASFAACLSAPVYRRARHVVEEQQRVEEGTAALACGDLQAFGDAMRRSHESSRDLYEVSIPELDVLAEVGWSSQDAFGARLAGGGFGGCVLVLVAADAREAVAAELQKAFLQRFGKPPDIFSAALAEGAQIVARATP